MRIEFLIFPTYVFVLVDKMNSLQKFYAISTAQNVNPSPMNRVATPPPLTLIASYHVKATSTTFGVDRLIPVTTALTIKDHPRASTTLKKKRSGYGPESPSRGRFSKMGSFFLKVIL